MEFVLSQGWLDYNAVIRGPTLIRLEWLKMAAAGECRFILGCILASDCHLLISLRFSRINNGNPN